MKKKIGLALLLIAVAVGTAFAQRGRDIPVETDWDKSSDVSILSVKQTLIGMDVTYSCGKTDLVNYLWFGFTAVYEDGTEIYWENKEMMLTKRKSSTFVFTNRNPSKIKLVKISWWWAKGVKGKL